MVRPKASKKESRSPCCSRDPTITYPPPNPDDSEQDPAITCIKPCCKQKVDTHRIQRKKGLLALKKTNKKLKEIGKKVNRKIGIEHDEGRIRKRCDRCKPLPKKGISRLFKIHKKHGSCVCPSPTCHKSRKPEEPYKVASRCWDENLVSEKDDELQLSQHRRLISGWKKFKLLMWKNSLQQVRRRFQTAAEIVMPVATMTLILIIRDSIDPQIFDAIEYPKLNMTELKYSLPTLKGMDWNNIKLAYSPDSPVLEDILDKAILRMIKHNRHLIDKISKDRKQVKKLKKYDAQFEELGLYKANLNNVRIADLRLLFELFGYEMYDILLPFNSSAEMRGIYYEEIQTRKIICAIEFDDSLLGAEELPHDLSFSVRLPKRPRRASFYGYGSRNWHTDQEFPLFEFPGPRYPTSYTGGHSPPYFEDFFVQIMHVVSLELIAHRTGYDVNPLKFYVRRFPHPPFVLDWVTHTMSLVLPTFLMLTFSYTAVSLVRAITHEKELQLKESMKIMGLSNWLHWTAWFCKQFIYLVITVVFLVIIMKVNWFRNALGFSEYAVITYTHWSIVFFFLTLYCATTICFCFLMSTFFDSANTASLCTGVVWFLIFVPSLLNTMEVQIPFLAQLFTCLSLNCAMAYGMRIILHKESAGGLRWNQFFHSPSKATKTVLFGHIVVMMIVDCFFYILLMLYIEQVFPGRFGNPKPWHFMFNKSFWVTARGEVVTSLKELQKLKNNKIFKKGEKKKKLVKDDTAVYQTSINSKPSTRAPTIDKDIIREPDPVGLKIGVEINKLRKVYGKHVAVHGMTLNIYEDQITVLLGHNGAGKTTLISMLTGNMAITSGSVSVAGYDVKTQLIEARRYLGLCPQHNVLFDELTVREHLLFFSEIKGLWGPAMHRDIDRMIHKLELDRKRDYLAGGLSGGQKRRLQVGIALCGATKVVLLDEPTSGMDPASRRALWELLQKEKIGRSIILTTHFMDEADILGDRIAIMAAGRLQCVGSPYFLKQHYGRGYTLVVVKTKDFNVDACIEVLRKYIPDIAVKEDRGSEVALTVSNEYAGKFDQMLTDLEANKGKIGFSHYGLSATSLEDVFLRVGSESPEEKRDSADENKDIPMPAVCRWGPKRNKETCFCPAEEVKSMERSKDIDDDDDRPRITPLAFDHVRATWFKLFIFWKRSWSMVLLQISAPILLMNCTLLIVRLALQETSDGSVKRPLELKHGYYKTETLLSYKEKFDPNDIYSWIATQTGQEYKKKYEGNDDMDLSVTNMDLNAFYKTRAKTAGDVAQLRTRILTGAYIKNVTYIAYFSNFAFHDIAISVAELSQALLRALSPDKGNPYTMTIYNHPLEAKYVNEENTEKAVVFVSQQLSLGIGNSVAIVSGLFVVFYIKMCFQERRIRAKLLQRAAGIQPWIMWDASLLFDWVWFMISVTPLIVSCACFQIIGLDSFAQIMAMTFTFMVYGFAFLPVVYVCSYLFHGAATGFVTLFFLNVVTGSIFPQMVEALDTELKQKAMAEAVEAVAQIHPIYCLVTAIRKLHYIGIVEHVCLISCEYIAFIMPTIKKCTVQTICKHFSSTCCLPRNPFWQWKEPGVVKYYVMMICIAIAAWIILMILEYRIYQKVFYHKHKPPPVDLSKYDEDVVKERDLVYEVGRGTGHICLVAKDLTKYYKKFLAVNRVFLTVSDTECFGLLGVNGAGKTSTFKMLMGDETVSYGNAYVTGYSVKTHITRVYENIGYCPQFDAVFNEMTGRETLRFFCMLRGMRDTAHETTIMLAHTFGFTKHLDKRSDQLSGGNRRKLSTAVALLGHTKLIFVDEPTTGIDPAARRQVWSALQAARETGRGVVLTSHSMEECEALCSRLTIMVNGRFMCLGTPQHLKNKFSQGFTLTIKIKYVRNSLGTTTAAVKQYVIENFTNPKIMEEYEGLITYYLPDKNIAWSKMFAVMEKAKNEMNVEDYSISQTSLEQIFLQFTKYQTEAHLEKYKELEELTEALTEAVPPKTEPTAKVETAKPGSSEATAATGPKPTTAPGSETTKAPGPEKPPASGPSEKPPASGPQTTAPGPREPSASGPETTAPGPKTPAITRSRKIFRITTTAPGPEKTSTPGPETTAPGPKTTTVPAEKPPAPGPETTTAPGPEKPPASGPEITTAPGPEKPSATGPETTTAPGPEKPPASGPEITTAPGPEKPSATGSETTTAPGPEKPSATGPETTTAPVPEKPPASGPEKPPASGPETTTSGPETTTPGPKATTTPGPKATTTPGPKATTTPGPEKPPASGPETIAPGPEKPSASGPETTAPGPKEPSGSGPGTTATAPKYRHRWTSTSTI